MKTLSTQHPNFQLNWYGIVLFSTLMLLTGINLNGQTVIPLTVNASPRSGSISAPGESDLYSFVTYSKPTRLTIQTYGTFNTYMYLYRLDGTTPIILGENDNSGIGLNAMISRTDLNASSTYYIRIRAYSPTATGSYSINVINETMYPPITDFQGTPGPMQVILNWTKPLTGSPTAYKIYSSPSQNGNYTLLATTSSGFLVNNTIESRWYYITAVYGTVESSPHSEINITPFPYLSAVPTSISLGYASGSTGTFTITSNIAWSITENASWLDVTPISGTNNRTITVTANSALTGTISRSASITVGGSGVVAQSVKITQLSPIQPWTNKNIDNYWYAGRYGHAMAYLGDDKIVLFGGHSGGYLDDTDVYDLSSNSWIQLSPGARPSFRRDHAMAYIGNNKVLLFGGSHNYDPPLGDTWLFNGSNNTWTLLAPAASPSGRSGHKLVYMGDDKVLLFGSGGGNETWIFDLSDNNWIQKQPALSPSARTAYAMAKIGDGKAVLFGGVYKTVNGEPYCDSETWIYDLGTNTWTQKSINPAKSPGSRYSSAMAYLGAGKAVLYGGCPYNSTLGDTWIYDMNADSWSEVSSTSNPPALVNHAFAETNLDGVVVLFGGSRNWLRDDLSRETWVFKSQIDELTVSPASISLGSSSGSAGTIAITSNTTWSITDDASWLNVSPSSGSNNGTITVTATSANTGTSSRSATVTIAGTGVTNKTVIVTQQAPAGKSLGNTEVYSLSSTTANRRAMTVTFGEAGEINSISIYHNGGTGSVLLGVYSDQAGTPGTRLGVTSSTVISPTAGWQTISLMSPVAVSSGQKVWLSWVFQTNPGMRYTTGTPARAQSTASWAGGMPATFGSASYGNYKYSVYCSYTPGGTPSHTLGNTEVYSLSSTTANRRAMTITFSEAGEINSISVYHNGGTGSVLLGVYSDQAGTPGTRLGVTSSTVISSTAGWQTISLMSPVAVRSGQKVWLSWVFETNPGVRYTTGTPARAQSTATWAGGMPATFGSATYGNYKYSVYCTYTAGGTPSHTLGNTEVYSLSSTTANRRAMTITFSEAGEIKSISVYHNGGTGSVLLGVYSDLAGTPGTRLGVTASTVISPTAGWQTISLTSPVPVSSGQKVWLSWVFQTNPGMRYTTGTPARAQSTASWASGMPATFGSASFGNYKYSVYCTYTFSDALATKSAIRSVDIKSIIPEKEKVVIYPNPTNGNVTVSWTNHYDCKLILSIYNMQGTPVKTVQIEPEINEVKVELQNIEYGMYILELKDTKSGAVINRSTIIRQ